MYTILSNAYIKALQMYVFRKLTIYFRADLFISWSEINIEHVYSLSRICLNVAIFYWLSLVVFISKSGSKFVWR